MSESAPVVPAPAAPCPFTSLEEWLVSNGGSFPKMELRSFGSANSSSLTEPSADKETKEGDGMVEMRGVHAKSDVESSEVCVSVPRKCLITVEMGKATDIGKMVAKHDLDLDAPKHVYLMIFLLVDRTDPDSFFRPYYDVLPKALDNMPIFWSKEDLANLNGSYLLRQIADRQEAIESDYKLILSVCPALAKYASLQDFMWARMCVCSRNFGLIINGVRTSALVPYADMLNHYRPRETKWAFNNDMQAFTITTLQQISCGSQIYDSYGQKCNHRFLLNYGFAVEKNIEADGFCPNEVPIVVSLEDEVQDHKARCLGQGQEQDSDQDQDVHLTESQSMAPIANDEGGSSSTSTSSTSLNAKLQFWTRDGSSPLKRVRVCVSNNDNTKSLLSMLRVKVADETDMQTVLASGPYMYRSCKDIRFGLSINNEKGALTMLKVSRDPISLPSPSPPYCSCLPCRPPPPLTNTNTHLAATHGTRRFADYRRETFIRIPYDP